MASVPHILPEASPAKQGEVVVIYLSGMGATSPAVKSGQPAPGGPNLAKAVVQPTVTLNGQAASVQFAGLSPGFVGLYQVNFAGSEQCRNRRSDADRKTKQRIFERYPDSGIEIASTVLGEQISRAAGRARVGSEKKPVPMNQILLQKPRCRIPAAASDAHIAPGIPFHFFLNTSKIKSPTVSACTSAEDAIE